MRSLALILVLGVLALAGLLTWRWLSMRSPDTARAEGPVAVAEERPAELAPSQEGTPDRAAVEPPPEAEPPPETARAPAATSVRGVVLRPDGTPASQAEVWTGTLAQATAASRGTWPPGLSRQETAADGRFELSALGPGALQLCATQQGSAPSETLRLELSEGQSLEDVTLQLRVGARIRGEVYRPDGAPAAGRLLRLSQAEHGQHEEVSADGKGRFLAERLVPGLWRIDTFPDERELAELGPGAGGLGGLDHLSTASVEVDDGEEAFVVLGLPSGTQVRVHGRVMLAGEPVGAVLQWVRLGSGGAEGMVMGQAGEDGAYAVELDAPGAWQVTVATLGGVSGRADLTLVVPPVREHERDLELPGGAIAGHVRTPDGLPLQGVDVELRVLEGAQHRSPMALPGDVAITDAEGFYTFPVLEPGTYAVAAQGWEPEAGDPAFASAAREDVLLAPGARVENVDFLLEPGHKVRGFVRDTDAKPVAGAVVHVFDAVGRALNPIASRPSAAQGWFTTRPLASGRYTLVACFRERVSDPLPVEVASLGLGDVVLVLRPGADLVVEWSAAGTDPREVVPFVQVTDRDGRRWGGLRDRLHPFGWRESPADPHLPRAGPLPMGTYVVVASLSDGRRGKAQVTLSAPGEQRLRLVLE